MAENRLKFDRMIRLSEQGDERAIQELKSYIRRSAPYANKNLRALEQADLTDYAYGRAMTYLESETLSRSFSGATRNRELSDMIDEATEIHTFLRSSTHTVAGASDAWSKQQAGLLKLKNEFGYNVPIESDDIKRVSKLITKNPALKNIGRSLGNDGLKFKGAERYELIEAINSAIENKLSDPEIQLIIDRYASGEIIYNEVLEDFNNKSSKDIEEMIQ